MLVSLPIALLDENETHWGTILSCKKGSVRVRAWSLASGLYKASYCHMKHWALLMCIAFISMTTTGFITKVCPVAVRPFQVMIRPDRVWFTEQATVDCLTVVQQKAKRFVLSTRNQSYMITYLLFYRHSSWLTFPYHHIPHRESQRTSQGAVGPTNHTGVDAFWEMRTRAERTDTWTVQPGYISNNKYTYKYIYIKTAGFIL